MTKQIVSKTTISIVIVAMVIFSGQTISRSAFAQGGPAGNHDEIVERLKDKLTAINNEALTSEITPILNDSGESDLGTRLLEAFLLGVKRIENIVPKFSTEDNTMLETSEKLEAAFSEMDMKASLLQVYYDALSPEKRRPWGSNGALRMNNAFKTLVDSLKTRGFVRPATQIESYKTICFKSNEDILKQLKSNNRIETMIVAAAERMKASRSSSYDSYDSSYDDYSSEPDMPPREEKPAELTLMEQIEGLILGTATAEQVMPLCQLLAQSTDNLVESKRNELNKLRAPASRPAMNAPYGSDDSMDSDMYGTGSRPSFSESSPTFASRTVTPSTQVNVAGYLNSEIRIFMAKNLKPMIPKAEKVNDKDTLIKAWCALSEGANFSDIYLRIMLEVNALESGKQNQEKLSSEWLELISAQSGYNTDYRVLITASGMAANNRPNLSIQMCFNIGPPIVTLIRNCLVSPDFNSQAKVALIEALQYIGDPDAAEFLIPLLVSNDPNIVRAAADAIGAVGDRRATVALLKGLNNPRLADTIVGILKKMGHNSQNDIILMFKQGKPEIDRFCIDILRDGGDINALPALAAVLRRYHNSPSMKDLPQAEKSEMLMLAMQAGTSIISRNMKKNAPLLTIPTLVSDGEGTRFDFGTGAAARPDAMRGGISPDYGDMSIDYYDTMLSSGPSISSSSDSSMSSSGVSGGSGENATMVALDQLVMTPDDIQNNAPFVWLEMIYIVASKHVADSAKLMEDIRTENSGRKIGTVIRNERVDREFFRNVINTSEEGLSAYLTSRSDVRKLRDQKERVIRSLGTYKRQENRIAQSKSSHNAFVKATTGVDPNASGTSTGSGTTTPQQRTNPLGRRL